MACCSMLFRGTKIKELHVYWTDGENASKPWSFSGKWQSSAVKLTLATNHTIDRQNRGLYAEEAKSWMIDTPDVV